MKATVLDRGRGLGGKNLILRLMVGLLLIAGGISTAHAQSILEPVEGETAAVLGFQAEGLSASAAEALSNVVRKIVLENGRLILIDRDRTEAVLAEQGFIMAGGCYDVSCLVEAGRVLGANRVITGSINLLGRKYLIELRSANVGTGRIEALETAEYRGEVEGLTEPVNKIAKRLVARLINDPGIIFVETEPRSSAVEVDGEPIGFAPIRIERPGGVEYKILASRFGYQNRSTMVHLAEHDSVHVILRLDKEAEERRRRGTPAGRLFVSGGFPLNQASSNLDTRISWGSGQTFGGLLQFGTDWRLSFGGYSYRGEIDDVDNSILAEYDVIANPESEALVYYSSLTAMLGDEYFAPFIGGGLCAMGRTVTKQYDPNSLGSLLLDEDTESLSTDFEVGWTLSMGVEIGITRFLTMQVEMLHARALSSERSWWKDTENEPDPSWTESFKAFESFTIFRMNVGLKL
ncbi:PEGA domain-containing protein [bacterium]|nr:PEGA domain-containing protein [bacterium]